MLYDSKVRINSLGDVRPSQYMDKKPSRDGDFEVRKIVSNVATKTSYISLPVRFIRKMRLSTGQQCSIQLVIDEDNSRLVISPLHIPGVTE